MKTRTALGLIGLALLCMAFSCDKPPDGGRVCGSLTDCECLLPFLDGSVVKWRFVPCPDPPPSPPSPSPDPPSPPPSPDPPTPSPPVCPAVPSCECGEKPGELWLDDCGVAHPVCADCPPPTVEPDCKVEFTPHRTTWGFLGCAPASEGCDGNGCVFTVSLGTKCSTDSTPTYLGARPNWKTCECAGAELPCPEWPACTNGQVGRSEYPPGPRAPKPNKPGHPGYYGFQCSVPTVWTVPAGVKHNEHDGFGGVMIFETKGRFTICAAPKGRPAPELRTCKTAVVQ